jgi:hypothetical protein
MRTGKASLAAVEKAHGTSLAVRNKQQGQHRVISNHIRRGRLAIIANYRPPHHNRVDQENLAAATVVLGEVIGARRITVLLLDRE